MIERSRMRPFKTMLGQDQGRQRGGDVQDTEAEEIACGQYDKPPVRLAKDPGMPTDEEVEEREAAHIPHRSWCPVCVRRHAGKKMRTER